MTRIIVGFIAYLVWFAATVHAQVVAVSILIDLDSTSAAQTVIVESIAADGKTSLDGIGASIAQVTP